MKFPTFADRVAVYLDQYKAAGKFISVDPDGDGKKQAIFVTDSGTVNPQSDSPGYWKDFKQKGPGSPSKKQHKDSPGQLGTHEDPFTGKYTRKPETQQRLDDKPPAEPPETPGWVDDDKPVQDTKKKRLPPGFKKAAVGVHLPDDATSEEIAALHEMAMEIVAERSQEIQAGQDALRSVFGDGTSLTGAQSQARAASDVDQIKGFDEAVAEIESSGGWKNDQSLLHDIVAYMPGGKIKWAAGADGNVAAEQIVFEALRMPLPKPPKATNSEVLSQAAQRLTGTDKLDDRDVEERDRDAQYNELMRQANVAAQDDDWDLYDSIKEQIADEFPETVSETADTFSAKTFRDAVARYAGQLGLFEDPFTGKYAKKPGSQGRLFDSSGGSWKDQPRKKKGDKGGGQWTKGNSPTSTKMSEAREKLREKRAKGHEYERSKQQRRKISATLDKYGGEERLKKAKPYELTQQEFLMQSALEIEKQRKSLLNKKKPSEAEKYLQKWSKEHSNNELRDWHEFAMEFKELDGARELVKKFGRIEMGLDQNRHGFGYYEMQETFGWLAHPEMHTLDRDSATWSVADFITGDSYAKYSSSELLNSLLSKHRDKVRAAVKNNKNVPKAAYEIYQDAPWRPDNQGNVSRKSSRSCQEVDKIKQTDAFRLDATVGRKLKTASKEIIDKPRKELLAKHDKMQEEISKVQKKIDDEVYNKSPKRNPDGSIDQAADKARAARYRELRAEVDQLRDKQGDALMDWLKELPSNRLRKEGSKPAIAITTGNTKFAQTQIDSVAKAAQYLEDISGGALPAMTVQLRKTSESRSFHRSGDIHMNSSQMYQAVLCHELGHAIDYHTDQGRKTKAFEAQAIQKHKTKWTGGGCEADEVGSKDGFMDAYTGKYYNRPKSSEVLTMGIQRLIETPMKFARTAPDHFNFTIASLRGLL